MSRPTGEVTLWAAELAGGALPRVCAMSGQQAAGTVRVQYLENPHAAWAGLIPFGRGRLYVVKGRLPMSTRWIMLLSLLRVLLLLGIFSFVYGLLDLAFTRPATAINWGLLAVGLLAVVLWALLRRRLEPAGEVHRDASGNAWVVISGVHPNFVAAVAAARSATPAPPNT
jgi:hypothetical protein